MFSLASKLLSTIATPTFEKAYEKGCSIWEAKDELRKLRRSIHTIQAVLLDAENRQDTSAAVKDWIDRVSDVLYDADDLFDEVATDEILKRQIIEEGKLLKKVRASCSKLNPVVSRNSIANQVKAIRKRLLEISTDMAQFNFAIHQHEEPISGARQGQDPGSFVDSKDVVGRDEDKKVILELLLDGKSNNGEQDVSVIAIVGIGGMGKTTLAQLVYSGEEVQKGFEKRWFACISDTSDDKEIVGKIFQSVCEENYGDFTLSQLQTKIRKSVEGERFLLVLDDVWDEDRASWQHRMSLLRGGANGSKIIVTTRSLSVARALGALEAQTHNLEGLSENESWDLFKRVAFTPEQEIDPRWANLGREIVKKCASVPLAIRSVGSLLYTKATIQEWESFQDNELSKLELSGDSIMQTLKLSYDHLPSNLKRCFAYCSLFPKDHLFDMDDLIYLWIAQGYIKPNHEMQTVEQAGYSYFMELLRRSFFQKTEDCEYKMHDLLHDLAQRVAGEEFLALTKPPNELNKKRARHVSVSVSQEVCVAKMINTSRLRSLVYFPLRDIHQHKLSSIDRQFTYGKYLRALTLSGLRIGTVSSCIGELKHLRYLNLSGNLFKSLPDSLTNLLNLLTLDIKECCNLEALPDSFRKLINLRHLYIEECYGLNHMPPVMGELTCLQKLSHFKVGKAMEGVRMSGLDALAGLKLRGDLTILFSVQMDGGDGDECWKTWQLPVSLEDVCIWYYPGRRIPHWSNDPSLLPNLSSLTLLDCRKVKHLPPLRCLPNLKFLHLVRLEELEYIEDTYDECTSFFPLLATLTMNGLRKLKGWARSKAVVATTTSFPLLSFLEIKDCEVLESFPQCPCVETIGIINVPGIQHLLSASTSPFSSLQKMFIFRCEGLVSFPEEALASLRLCHIQSCPSLDNLRLLASLCLEDLQISFCNGLTSVEVEALPSLVSLVISCCGRLKSLRIAHLSVLREFTMRRCPQELELWGCVDWNSLPNLHLLNLDRLLSPEELPDCLRHLQALGQLQLINESSEWE